MAPTPKSPHVFDPLPRPSPEPGPWSLPRGLGHVRRTERPDEEHRLGVPRGANPRRRASPSSAGRARRLGVFKRDGWRCIYCGQPVAPGSVARFQPNEASVDHVVARHFAGRDGADNLVCACRACNEARRHTPLPEWLRVTFGAILAAAALERVRVALALVPPQPPRPISRGPKRRTPEQRAACSRQRHRRRQRHSRNPIGCVTWGGVPGALLVARGLDLCQGL